ncbi:MAG TPA: DUF2891 domain-containing protein, partial [Bacteroidetes bacterium]|nr:DUF2891 domain-containing protein [Bacteroidota bacterium]
MRTESFLLWGRKLYSTLAFLLLLNLSVNAQYHPGDHLRMDEDGKLLLTQTGASHFAALALSCLQQEYPNKPGQTLSGKDELKEPHVLHPAFYGCYDWHSSVHGHWMLVRLLKQFPDLPEASEIRRTLEQNLTAKNIAAEVDYFKKESKSWERMYGWAWLLKLADELFTWNDPDARQWYKHLEPLTNAIVERYLRFLPVQTYPVRTGVHPNTAFGMSFAWDYANTTDHRVLKSMIEKRAKDYYLLDEGCPTEYEPSGEDFLSPCLEEANLMRKVLPKKLFSKWFRRFLPKSKMARFNTPANVSD